MEPIVPAVPAVQAAPAVSSGAKIAASLAGALAVAVAAQVAIPVPGSPVPFTLQPMAVLIVGGLLGARYGALSLVMYLAMGSLGLPVFAPLGVPGFARLLGPTGGFLLSYPFAAAVTGTIARRFEVPTLRLALLAAMAGMIVIFIGGISQLAIVTPGHAINFGLLPFAPADLVKVAIAALVIRRFLPSTRALA